MNFKFSRRKLLLVSTVVFIVFFGFIVDHLITGSGVLSERYGINPVVIAWLFGVSEVFFNVGIILILFGSGIFSFSWKQIRSFKLHEVKFTGSLVFVGFLVNRAAAIVPWLYVLAKGWGKLPGYVEILIILEIVIVLLIGLSVKIPLTKD